MGEHRGSTKAVTACNGKLRADDYHDGSPCPLWVYRTAEARRQTKAKAKQARQANQRPAVGQFSEEQAADGPWPLGEESESETRPGSESSEVGPVLSDNQLNTAMVSHVEG